MSRTVKAIHGHGTWKQAEHKHDAVRAPTREVDKIGEDEFGRLFWVCPDQECNKNEESPSIDIYRDTFQKIRIEFDQGDIEE